VPVLVGDASCDVSPANPNQDLCCLGRELAHTIIVDNSPHSYVFQPDNAVPIGTFIDDMEDQELLDILPILMAVERASNAWPPVTCLKSGMLEVLVWVGAAAVLMRIETGSSRFNGSAFWVRQTRTRHRTTSAISGWCGWGQHHVLCVLRGSGVQCFARALSLRLLPSSLAGLASIAAFDE
jgi:NLI interacting factor-like phosphatase